MLRLFPYAKVINHPEGLRVDDIDGVGSAVRHVNSLGEFPNGSAQFPGRGLGINIVRDQDWRHAR